MNKKTLMAGIVAGTMILGAACTANAAFDFNFSTTKTESTSETKTVEDSQGNQYQVTHTIETVNGDTSEFYENVPFEIYNETAENITGFYMVPSEADNWGTNFVEAVGDDFVLEETGHIWGMTMNYNPDASKFDVKVVFADGNKLEFNECGMTEVDDAYHVNVELYSNGDGNYTLYLV